MAKMQLKNVRLSFPSIFKKAVFKGVEGKFEATLLLDKADKKTKKKLDEVIEAAIKEAKVKVPSDKRCIKDGDDAEYDGYEGMWSVKASNSKRPTLINRDKGQIVEEDDVLYAGCYVNAIIDIWIQNNEFGKRANANLYGLQFVKDGDAFGRGNEDVTDDFDDLEDELDDEDDNEEDDL
tara:strand:+ start:5742 stop:6278 length:537 start_codon:yes stop_codon:yes gene_type:complete